MESSSFCFCSNSYPNIEAFKRRTCRRSLRVVECLTCWLDINCQDFWWDQDPALNRLFVSTDRQKWAEIFWVAAEVAYQDSGFSCRSWQLQDPSAQTLQCFPFQWRLHVWKSRLKLPVGWSYEFFGQVACWGFQWAHSRMMTSFGLCLDCWDWNIPLKHLGSHFICLTFFIHAIPFGSHICVARFAGKVKNSSYIVRNSNKHFPFEHGRWESMACWVVMVILIAFEAFGETSI